MKLELTSLENATASLERSVHAAAKFEATLPPELRQTVRSGIIQNFEVAYELSWKMMKRWLETNISAESVDGATRRELFRQATENRLIEDVDLWMSFHAARNVTSHTTVFIKGNHEDFVWLDVQPSSEVLPGLHYLRNGHVHELLAGDEMLRVGGVGGCFGPSNFERRSSTLQGYAKRHYTRDEIAKLSARADLDIVLTHDAPAGVRFERHRRGEGFVSESAGLDELLAKTRPRVCFFGYHHTRLDAEVAGVRCVGLNKGHYPGCLVAFEMKPGERAWRVLGEWPPKEPRP